MPLAKASVKINPFILSSVYDSYYTFEFEYDIIIRFDCCFDFWLIQFVRSGCGLWFSGPFSGPCKSI